MGIQRDESVESRERQPVVRQKQVQPILPRDFTVRTTFDGVSTMTAAPLTCSLGSLAHAEDAAQEPLLRAWRHHDSVKEGATLRPWL